MIIKKLVFEGGGVKGIAYGGALKALEESNHLNMHYLEKIAGTSAGAITAMAVALGYTADKIINLLRTKDFNEFKELSHNKLPPGFSHLANFLQNEYRKWRGFGKYSNHKLIKWIKKLIREKEFNENISFAELKQQTRKSLFVAATDISTNKPIHFSPDEYHDTPIYLGVIASMAYPIFFKAVKASPIYDANNNIRGFNKAKTRNENARVFIDGGLLENCPVNIFDKIINPNSQDPNLDLIILRLDSQDEINQIRGDTRPHANKVHNLIDYATNTVATVMNNQNYVFSRNKTYVKRSIFINTLDIPTMAFNLTAVEKNNLINEGKKAVANFLNINGKNLHPNIYEELASRHSLI